MVVIKRTTTMIRVGNNYNNDDGNDCIFSLFLNNDEGKITIVMMITAIKPSIIMLISTITTMIIAIKLMLIAHNDNVNNISNDNDNDDDNNKMKMRMTKLRIIKITLYNHFKITLYNNLKITLYNKNNFFMFMIITPMHENVT